MSSDAARPQKWDIGVLHGFRTIMVLLVANFVGQVIAFFQSIYTELIFRF